MRTSRERRMRIIVKTPATGKQLAMGTYLLEVSEAFDDGFSTSKEQVTALAGKRQKD